jgi:hypothetical protein
MNCIHLDQIEILDLPEHISGCSSPVTRFANRAPLERGFLAQWAGPDNLLSAGSSTS